MRQSTVLGVESADGIEGLVAGGMRVIMMACRGVRPTVG
jgi:hypothetical protein